ncbi:MAG: hypothetical protein R6U61_08395 [Thermoplasmata archaeon]
MSVILLIIGLLIIIFLVYIAVRYLNKKKIEEDMVFVEENEVSEKIHEVRKRLKNVKRKKPSNIQVKIKE